MPTTAEFLATLLLAAAYAASTLGFYAILRRGPFSRPLALALSVPLCQAFYSFLFQLRFLFGMGAVGDGLAWLAAVALAVAAATQIPGIRHDLADLARLGLRYWWAGIPLLVTVTYGAFQVLLLPPLNLDGIAYHLPRVFLFQQTGSLFLEHFSSYHQAVFPVGGDLLFHPFLALGTDHGLGIFSLGSYLAVGAAAYSIARKLTSRGRAVLAALSILCLDLIVLQSVTIKNDILVAAVAGSSLALALEIRAARQVRRLLLLALLCAYGLSIKLTFLAFIPGLAALVFIRLRLWETARIRDLSGSLRRDLRLCLAALPVILVFSQVWLFAFNTHHYGSWNGPPEFTHRHGQHDGALGAAANLLRYGMQAAQFGYVTDRYLAERIGLPRPTDVANEIYQSYAEPIVGSVGATREPFHIIWAQHEDFAWFGPLGAVILFLFVPFALRKRKREALVLLLPALGYLLIVAAKISWMPWSGRFFTPFMVALAPALAIGLESIRARSVLAGLGLLACFQLTVTKVVDFERYLIPVVSMIRENEPLAPGNLYHHAVDLGQNRWNPEVLASATEYGPRRSLLEKVPPGSRIGLYNVHHRKDFRFFHVRPDLAWQPLKFSRGRGERDLNEAVAYFLDNDLDYLVIYGRFQGRPPAPVLAREASPPLTLLGKPEKP